MAKQTKGVRVVEDVVEDVVEGVVESVLELVGVPVRLKSHKSLRDVTRNKTEIPLTNHHRPRRGSDLNSR